MITEVERTSESEGKKMNKWKELDNVETAVSIISAMVESMDMIKYLIRKAGSDPDKFDYHVDIADHRFSLYDDGFQFASGNINGFKNPADFMSWVLEAISDYYYDVEEVEEDE